MKVEVKSTDLDSLIVYAVRYALGRQSYAVSEVAIIVDRYKDFLAGRTINTIIKDLQSPDLFGGMDMDERMWNALLDTLTDHMRQRQSEAVRSKGALLHMDKPGHVE